MSKKIFRIEFIGPMGSGKSTISKLLLNKLKASLLITSEINSIQLEKKEILLNKLKDKSYIQYLSMKTLLKVPSLNRNLVSNRISSEMWRLFETSDDIVQEFTKIIYNELYSCKPNDVYLLQRLSLFTRDLTDYLLINNCSNKSLILHDESLLQRGISLAASLTSWNNFLNNYCDCAPISDFVIYVKGDRLSLSNRILQRNVLVERYLEDLDDFIKYSNSIAKICKKKGVNIIELNGFDELDYNVHLCISEIQKKLSNSHFSA